MHSSKFLFTGLAFLLPLMAAAATPSALFEAMGQRALSLPQGKALQAPFALALPGEARPVKVRAVVRHAKDGRCQTEVTLDWQHAFEHKGVAFSGKTRQLVQNGSCEAAARQLVAQTNLGLHQLAVDLGLEGQPAAAQVVTVALKRATPPPAVLTVAFKPAAQPLLAKPAAKASTASLTRLKAATPLRAHLVQVKAHSRKLPQLRAAQSQPGQLISVKLSAPKMRFPAYSLTITHSATLRAVPSHSGKRVALLAVGQHYVATLASGSEGWYEVSGDHLHGYVHESVVAQGPLNTEVASR